MSTCIFRVERLTPRQPRFGDKLLGIGVEQFFCGRKMVAVTMYAWSLMASLARFVTKKAVYGMFAVLCPSPRSGLGCSVGSFA